jgi:hypothetical protein
MPWRRCPEPGSPRGPRPTRGPLRALAAPAAGIAVSNGDGAAGDPTLALANDLAAVEALSATGLAARTASDTWATRAIAVSGTGLSVANGSGVSGNPTVTIDPAAVVAAGGVPALATQADQETATSTTTFVSPARQHFHPSAAKCWARVTVSGGAPTLQENYNITSISDTGTGRLTITIATDFSGAGWCALSSTMFDYGSNQMTSAVQNTTMAAGSVEIDSGFTGTGRVDPNAWYFVGFGDQ